MELAVSLAALLGALALGAMSPGPSFVLVARTAVARSRAHGLAAALGMGIGGVIFSVLVVLGLHAALSNVPRLYLGSRLPAASTSCIWEFVSGEAPESRSRWPAPASA
jgi:threonine/homoserine/homoserine lactone efflux protein